MNPRDKLISKRGLPLIIGKTYTLKHMNPNNFVTLEEVKGVAFKIEDFTTVPPITPYKAFSAGSFGENGELLYEEDELSCCVLTNFFEVPVMFEIYTPSRYETTAVVLSRNDTEDLIKFLTKALSV
jgi:hypothetical protein